MFIAAPAQFSMVFNVDGVADRDVASVAQTDVDAHDRRIIRNDSSVFFQRIEWLMIRIAFTRCRVNVCENASEKFELPMCHSLWNAASVV